MSPFPWSRGKEKLSNTSVGHLYIMGGTLRGGSCYGLEITLLAFN